MADLMTDVTLEKKWRARFLDKLAESGSVTRAAKYARISRMTAYRERADDPEFAAAWDVAKERGVDALEDEAIDRAFDGSDILLMFRLKAERPKYRDKQPTGLNLTLEQLQQMSDHELDDLAAKLARLG
jgi:hypothetical protein